MRQPLDLDKLKSSLSEITIGGKVYKVGAVPVGILVELYRMRDGGELENFNAITKHLIHLFAKQNDGFDEEVIRELSMRELTELMMWVMTDIGTTTSAEEVKKKSEMEINTAEMQSQSQSESLE